MKNEFYSTLVDIEKELNLARETGHKSFKIEVTTPYNFPNYPSNHYFVVVNAANEITTYIRYTMNHLFDNLGYTGHDVFISDVSEDGYHSRQITVRF